MAFEEENKPQEQQEQGDAQGRARRQYRTSNNLYARSKVSVKLLDALIALGVVALVVVFMLSLRNRGFSVTFDSVGGSDVPAQTRMYGDFVEEPPPPTREGYRFEGWYWDKEYKLRWDFAGAPVKGEMFLYARWVPRTE